MNAPKPFEPPEKAERHPKRPGEGWVSVGAGLAEKWRGEKGLRYTDLESGTLWAVSGSQISLWLSSKRIPTPPQRVQVEKSTKGAVAAESWLWWFPPEGRAQIADAAIPSSEALGDTLSEMRASAGRLKALLANPALQAKQRADLEGKLLIALGRIAAREAAIALEDHPDFDGFVELVLSALEATFERRGLSSQGLRGLFATELERLENKSRTLSEAA